MSRTLKVRNPATGELITTLPAATEAEVAQAAVRAAKVHERDLVAAGSSRGSVARRSPTTAFGQWTREKTVWIRTR